MTCFSDVMDVWVVERVRGVFLRLSHPFGADGLEEAFCLLLKACFGLRTQK